MGLNIADILGGSIGEAFSKIVGVFKVDPTIAFQKKAEIEEIQLQLQSKLQDQLNAQLQGQLDTNKQEAASTKMFVAGWRPFIGWNGIDDQSDCECCGDRWYPQCGDGDAVPSVYEMPVHLLTVKNELMKWQKGYECFVHYTDGRIVGYYK